MEPLTMITLIVTFIGALVIGYAKFYERKISSGETWSDQKFGMFFIVCAAIMILVYFTTGNTQFPEEQTINALYTLIEPMAALFGLSIATITGGRILKAKVISPVAAGSSAPVTPTTPGETNWLAITVTPTYQSGKSPEPVQFKMWDLTVPTSDHPGIINIDVDFGDGTSMVVTPVNGQANFGHIFTYVKPPEGKYDSKTFYPIFKVNGSDGSSRVYNAEGQRRICEINVAAI